MPKGAGRDAVGLALSGSERSDSTVGSVFPSTMRAFCSWWSWHEQRLQVEQGKVRAP